MEQFASPLVRIDRQKINFELNCDASECTRSARGALFMFLALNGKRNARERSLCSLRSRERGMREEHSSCSQRSRERAMHEEHSLCSLRSMERGMHEEHSLFSLRSMYRGIHQEHSLRSLLSKERGVHEKENTERERGSAPGLLMFPALQEENAAVHQEHILCSLRSRKRTWAILIKYTMPEWITPTLLRSACLLSLDLKHKLSLVMFLNTNSAANWLAECIF